MRRLIGWLAGLAGVAALLKLLHRRSQTAASPTGDSVPAEDPADELRRKLAEARASAATVETASPAPTASDPAGAEPEPGSEAEGPSIEERRANVHARAQAAIDSMREDAE